MLLYVNTETEPRYTEGELEQGVRQGDSIILEHLYKVATPAVNKFVLDNNGTTHDTADVLSKGLMILYQRMKARKYKRESGISGFYYGICKKIWLNKLGKSGKTITFQEESPDIPDDDLELEMLTNKRLELLHKHIKALDDICQQLLHWVFNRKKLKDFAVMMNWKENNAKQKSYSCRQQLIKLVREDPAYQYLRTVGGT